MVFAAARFFSLQLASSVELLNSRVTHSKPEKPSKAALLNRTSAQRIPSRPGALCSNEGRIHLRRPSCQLSFFACDKAADHTFRLADKNEAAGAADASRVQV
jgi:hypothetical protein